MADQKSQPVQPPKPQATPSTPAPVPAFQQTTTRAFGLGGSTSQVEFGGKQQPGSPQPSLFGAHRERLDAQAQAARNKPQKASIYAKDIEAFKLGNEQERTRTGGPSR